MPPRDLERRRRPTLRDVAEAAGVSFKTVSRVVNGEGGVSPERTRRVEAAIARLSYQPDYWARRLRSGTRTGTIGMVLLDLANPFAAGVLRGAEEGASRYGAMVFAASHAGEVERELALISALIERHVDAMIVAPSSSPEVGRALAAAPMPIAILDQMVPGLSAVGVRSDHYGGARAATKHLLGRGHLRIAFLGDDPTLFSAAERRRGFADEMFDAELPIDDRLVQNERCSVEDWESRVSELFADEETAPTALVTAQNLVTLAATRAMQRLGLRRRVAHIGFDDVEFADLVEPGLTVVAQQPQLIGERAAVSLLDQVNANTTIALTDVVPCLLIERGSGELIPPGGG